MDNRTKSSEEKEETDIIDIGDINIYDNLIKDKIDDDIINRAEENKHIEESQYVDDNIKIITQAKIILIKI